METRGEKATYHVEALGDRETVFTAIEGEASVWRHADPGYVVFVPSYHQVRLSRTRISPPRRVSRDEIESIIHWRENFRQWREESLISVPDLRKRQVGEVRRMLDRLGLRLSVNPPNAGSEYRVYRQSPGAGTEVRAGTVVLVDVRADRPTATFPAVTVPTVIIPKLTVPNLRSKSLADARKVLERLGLGLRYSPRNAGENYWVSGQTPPAGRKVDQGTVLNLTLQPPIY
ncbi:PASTA domain-containing protein [uncultured Desulfobacter sp.]|uniref:PASTA domain-containing protein n=1 Tax=uncultured Desulfobacter sp. TaxID=240139 RepID=UPI00259B09E4|nr:PASTA domain-containing protein [uncultured Desulfobacter sp.]